MKVGLRVRDPSGTVTRDVLVDLTETGTVGELLTALVHLFEWPRQTMAGQAIGYELRRESHPAPLDPPTLLAQLALIDGELLVLGPVVGASR
jgi:hypothetical protein